MKAVIVGCGRVGALIASTLDAAGADVSIIDLSALAFDRLPATFAGRAIRGNGIDAAVLRRAGTADADLFLALTEGDNRNVMSAQLAAENFEVRRVVAKINDPVRAEAYAELGIATLCRTTLMTDVILAYLGMETSDVTGIRTPGGRPSGGQNVPTGASTEAADEPSSPETEEPRGDREASAPLALGGRARAFWRTDRASRARFGEG